jgi:hypothetical protein
MNRHAKASTSVAAAGAGKGRSANAARVIDFLSRLENRDLSNREVGRQLGMDEGSVRRARRAIDRPDIEPIVPQPIRRKSKAPQSIERKAIAPKSIEREGGTQIRELISEATLAEYADAWAEGAEFPPPVVFHDGADHWLADGFHRVLSAIRAGIEEIEVEVRAGGRREAILHAVGANAAHGLRRSNADKERAVRTLLDDPEWSAWSDREIGRRCRVDHKTVGRIRGGAHLGNSPDARRKAIRNGKAIEIETAGINGNRATAAEVEDGALEVEEVGSEVEAVEEPDDGVIPPEGSSEDERWLDSFPIRSQLALLGDVAAKDFDDLAMAWRSGHRLMAEFDAWKEVEEAKWRAAGMEPPEFAVTPRDPAFNRVEGAEAPRTWTICPLCHGSASEPDSGKQCPHCGGWGILVHPRQVKLAERILRQRRTGEVEEQGA